MASGSSNGRTLTRAAIFASDRTGNWRMIESILTQLRSYLEFTGSGALANDWMR
ncbi:hypothetical protein CP97_05365 [Aurantiacibacter atlanticus]|uniref:Uncharacterized protein n=1 Tax=Aurantiacibacter atlanticus TaxID=1648404 RepID=A0A0H4VEQ6_9SPHN|nr:hypothetical protein CP97_05365 [Aurantiacibacter atlanticus]